MALNTTYRTPVQLTAEARAAADLITGADPLSAFLPARFDRTLDFDLDADTLGLPRAAVFRSYDATAPYGLEQSVGSRKGSLPASSIKLPLGELQALRLQGSPADGIQAALDRKARQNGQSIAIRAIIARGQAIATGKVTLNENNLVTEIDFGRDPSLTVAAGTAWSDVDADIVADILSWVALVPQVGGCIVSTQILGWMAVNKSIIAMATGMGTTQSGVTRITRAQVIQVLQDLGLTQVTVYDKSYTDRSGTTVRPIAANVFVLVPNRDDVVIDGGPLGSTLWGVPAEALDDKSGISMGEQPGIFAGCYDHDDPVGFDVLASSIFLPVLSNPDITLAATVS